MSETTPHFPVGTYSVSIPAITGIRPDLLKNIAPIVQKSIAEGNYPGAVILAGHRGRIIYKGVFGNRRILPTTAPMRFDTIFDIASLTKVVATTPAIMQLVEQGKLDLDATVSTYWPEFSGHDKEMVTVRELLTHTSGLPAAIEGVNNQAEALQQIKQLHLKYPAGTRFFYSDVNFIILAYLVEILSGEPFDQYVQQHIFSLLKMNHTQFLPPANLQDRIAPTEIINNELRWGTVHDPIAFSIGGISGNAGLFSNASDLSLYAQCLLNGGRLPANQDKKAAPDFLLGPLTILKMMTPQTPTDLFDKRGLGWDIDSVYSNRGILFPIDSYGHTGWTGTSLWIDPVTQTWLIILTSRAHPTPANNKQHIQDRRKIANIIAGSLTDITVNNKNNTNQGELKRAYANENNK